MITHSWICLLAYLSGLPRIVSTLYDGRYVAPDMSIVYHYNACFSSRPFLYTHISTFLTERPCIMSKFLYEARLANAMNYCRERRVTWANLYHSRMSRMWSRVWSRVNFAEREMRHDRPNIIVKHAAPRSSSQRFNARPLETFPLVLFKLSDKPYYYRFIIFH